MKRITIIALMVTGFTIGTLSSCKKDDTSSKTTTTTDARDLAVGTYSGMSTITFDGQTITDTTTLTVAKGINKTIVIDGNILTSDIVVTGNDFSGNIPTQNVDDGNGGTYSIQGEGRSNEQFAFVASSKALAFEIRITGGALSGTRMSFFGTKN